jgi:predicted transcriptional regulator of viral defense system
MSLAIRRIIGREEFDYQSLMSALSNYASPRDRVTTLLKRGSIIRVKKGLYVFGKDYSLGPYSKEVLANLVYGPSIISMEYALAYHGLIPERVKVITSVAFGRSRRFDTPVGMFTYRQTRNLSIGVELRGTEDSRFLIATPERALADSLKCDRSSGLRSMGEMKAYLLENKRVSVESLRALDSGLLLSLADVLGSRKIKVCACCVAQLKKGG